MQTQLTPQQAERLIENNLDGITSRMSVYGWTVGGLSNLRNPYDLANIMPDVDGLYDYALTCDLNYYVTFIQDLLQDEDY